MPAAEYVTSIWISMKAEYVYPGDRVLESGTSASPVRWLQAINPSTSSKMLETHEQKKVIAISGSTRKNSINHSLINAIVKLSAASLDITVFDGIGNLPQFNPDNDGGSVAKEVADYRQQLNNAEGVIICTPEYTHGVPGMLKNAIDWTISSSSSIPHKTMLITASTGGNYGQKALMETLRLKQRM